ncbi:hypothetical protein [Patulibacter medicamentivorans]|uniref:hypothetical protein n=1 Tax=Patulibacter medicamentivorans TaxID=1097667 RepID=UPI00058CF1B7|nr:hypothetical protein [Patulibacter medicamentivorans]
MPPSSVPGRLCRSTRTATTSEIAATPNVLVIPCESASCATISGRRGPVRGGAANAAPSALDRAGAEQLPVAVADDHQLAGDDHGERDPEVLAGGRAREHEAVGVDIEGLLRENRWGRAGRRDLPT